MQVLLVEQNSVVRHCLLLFLRQLGMAVRAVSTEDQAIACLRLQGRARHPSSMHLRIIKLHQKSNIPKA